MLPSTLANSMVATAATTLLALRLRDVRRKLVPDKGPRAKDAEARRVWPSIVQAGRQTQDRTLLPFWDSRLRTRHERQSMG